MLMVSLLSLTFLGLFMGAVALFHRLSLDSDPVTTSALTHRTSLAASLQDDSARAAVAYAFPAHLLVNGAVFVESSYTPVVSGYAPCLGATAAFQVMQASFAVQGKALIYRAVPAGENHSSLIFLGANGNVVSYWKITNIVVGGGLRTVMERYANFGNPTLTRVDSYEQFLPGASLASPGGVGASAATRTLPGFAGLSDGSIQAEMPCAQVSGDRLSLAGIDKPEAYWSKSWTMILRPRFQPGVL